MQQKYTDGLNAAPNQERDWQMVNRRENIQKRIADLKPMLEQIDRLLAVDSFLKAAQQTVNTKPQMTSPKKGDDVTIESVDDKDEQADLVAWIKSQHRKGEEEDQTQNKVDEFSQEWFNFLRKFNKESSFDPTVLMQINDMSEYLYNPSPPRSLQDAEQDSTKGEENSLKDVNYLNDLLKDSS